MILNNNRLKSDSHYHFRLQLACLHFNENSNRMQDVTKDGEAQWQVSLPKYKQGAPVSCCDLQKYSLLSFVASAQLLALTALTYKIDTFQ